MHTRTYRHHIPAVGRRLYSPQTTYGGQVACAPPDGDLTGTLWRPAAETASKPAGRCCSYPGHGAPVDRPCARLDWLVRKSAFREADILRAPIEHGPATAARRSPPKSTPKPRLALLVPPTRNGLAHLIDLTGKNKIAPLGSACATASFRRVLKLFLKKNLEKMTNPSGRP